MKSLIEALSEGAITEARPRHMSPSPKLKSAVAKALKKGPVTILIDPKPATGTVKFQLRKEGRKVRAISVSASGWETELDSGALNAVLYGMEHRAKMRRYSLVVE